MKAPSLLSVLFRTAWRRPLSSEVQTTEGKSYQKRLSEGIEECSGYYEAQFSCVRLSVLIINAARAVACVTQICMQQSSSTQSYQYTLGRMTNWQKLEGGKANRDLLQACILIKQYVRGKQNMKLKSSLITLVSQVFLLSVWKSCITSNCVRNEITRMVCALFAFLY